MQLDPDAFNAHLNHMGQQFSWRRAYSCPCVNPHSGAAKPNCQHCKGVGYTWTAAVDGLAGVANQKTQLQWAQFGRWEDGDVVLTIQEDSPLYDMGKFDRVVMKNAEERFSLNLVRGQNDKLKMPVGPIERVFWYDANGELVEGGIPGYDADGTINWDDFWLLLESGDPILLENGGYILPEDGFASPPVGTTYSVTGTKRPEYYCWGQYPSNRNMHSGARLPKRVVLRTFDLFGRRDN